MINGNEFTISLGEDDDVLAVAHATSATMNVDIDTLEVTMSETASYQEFIPRRNRFNISFDGLIDYSDPDDRYGYVSLDDWLADGTVLDFRMGTDDEYYTGKGILTQLTQSGGSDEAASYSGSFMVTGDLDKGSDFEVFYLTDHEGNCLIDHNDDILTGRERITA